MQKSSPIHVGLDIGSSSVTCVVGVLEEEMPNPSIIGVGRSKNSGSRRGTIVDIEDTVAAITDAVDEAERLSGYPVDSATIGVDGSHTASQNSKGVIAVGGGNREINEDDVARVEEAATVVQLPPNREIIQFFPRNYRLDGQDNIKDPTGMSGVRLEVDAHIITGSTPALKNLQRSVYQVGININSQCVVGIAAAEAVLSKKQKESGVALVDIGGATTNVVVYEEGEVLHTATLPIGSGHITNDLAIGLRTDLDTAEKIKTKHASALSGKSDKKTFAIKDGNKEQLRIEHKEVDEIAEARLEELFDMVNEEFDKVHKAGKLPAGVVLTGGGAKLDKIDEFAKDALSLSVQIGKPHGFSGIADSVNDPIYASAVGLMLEDIHNMPAHGKNWKLDVGKASGFLSRFISRFKP